MSKDKVLEKIIEGYRNTIYQRYQYQNIKDTYGIPESINEETVNQLRNYFLNYMYPKYETRTALNEAFSSLDNYIKHPNKLLRILLDAAKLIFRYGRHLPKILNSGLNAMNTFKAATDFENNLVDKAIKNNIKAPYDLLKIDALIKLLSRKDIEKFILYSQSLFEILHDKVLIEKIKEVIQYLIRIMRERRDSYSLSEIKGLEIGLEMIHEGYKVFSRLAKEDQKNLVKLITDIEKDNLDHIF
jgi:Lhr-like helicase